MTIMAEPTQAQKDLAYALNAMRTANEAVCLWANSVSAEAEQRLGVDSEDEARFNDPAFAQALDMVGKCWEAQAALESVGKLPYALPGDER